MGIFGGYALLALGSRPADRAAHRVLRGRFPDLNRRLGSTARRRTRGDGRSELAHRLRIPSSRRTRRRPRGAWSAPGMKRASALRSTRGGARRRSGRRPRPRQGERVRGGRGTGNGRVHPREALEAATALAARTAQPRPSPWGPTAWRSSQAEPGGWGGRPPQGHTPSEAAMPSSQGWSSLEAGATWSDGLRLALGAAAANAANLVPAGSEEIWPRSWPRGLRCPKYSDHLVVRRPELAWRHGELNGGRLSAEWTECLERRSADPIDAPSHVFLYGLPPDRSAHREADIPRHPRASLEPSIDGERMSPRLLHALLDVFAAARSHGGADPSTALTVAEAFDLPQVRFNPTLAELVDRSASAPADLLDRSGRRLRPSPPAELPLEARAVRT